MINIIGATSVLGDTHGEVGAINYWISHGNESNLIHVGDWAIGFKGVEAKTIELGNKLNQAGKRVYVTMGNHENPSFFDNRIYGGEWGGVQFLKNGTVATHNGENILFCGGAISIDRNHRVANIDWWENAEFQPILPPPNIKIDHIITHLSIPEVNGVSVYSPNVLHWATNDGDLIHDLMMEQQVVRNWVNDLLDSGHPIKTWHYGHYHQSIQSEYKGIQCQCLAINEIRPFNRQPYS